MMRFFVLKQDEVHLEEGNVIPASQFSDIVSAQEIFEKAKKDADLLAEETQEEAIAIKEKAYQAGYQEGLAEFNDKLAWLDHQLKALRAEIQAKILPIALKAARKLIGRELQMHPELIVDIVIQSLASVLHSRRVTIYVHKSDLELLEATKPKLKAILAQADSVIIMERGGIERGGCIIETEGSIMNVTIENQWANLERAFTNYGDFSS